MAMNVWMTTSVFLVAVMATIVLGSTPLQEQKRNDRSSRKCCAVKSYLCLQGHGCLTPSDSSCAEQCKTTDTSTCGSNAGDNCCSTYKSCLVDCQISRGNQHGDPLLICYNHCSQQHPC
uniref:Conotoxin n=1 Tax=Conus betulinus TaxID=89764 RepID=A0A142C1I2_CONBE|nr:conotoxin [Conus betulinus]